MQRKREQYSECDVTRGRAIALKQMFAVKFLYLDGPELYTGGKYSTCIFLVWQDLMIRQIAVQPAVSFLLWS